MSTGYATIISCKIRYTFFQSRSCLERERKRESYLVIEINMKHAFLVSLSLRWKWERRIYRGKKNISVSSREPERRSKRNQTKTDESSKKKKRNRTCAPTKNIFFQIQAASFLKCQELFGISLSPLAHRRHKRTKEMARHHGSNLRHLCVETCGKYSNEL